MSQNIQAVRGMNDILPTETGDWQHLEAILRQLLSAYAYREIRFPIVEKTELFKRSIGEVTDIVEKEMYTFEDRNSDSLTLRPEGTACCVRAVIEHGLVHNQEQRLWYMGPMFRHERPQKGRYRQFYQVGVEVFGLAGPDIDFELLLMTARLWRCLGISESVVLQLNSLGSIEARARYREHLVEYFSKQSHLLDEDSQRRLTMNPLRILDSKNPAMQEMIQQAPQLLTFLDEESLQHFEQLKRYLDQAKIKYVINSRLVRGLDYYNRTVFEWVTEKLGSQGTICAGGRYDGLVELLGGKATPAIGFAMGLERIVALITARREADTATKSHEQLTPAERSQMQIPDVYFIMAGEKATEQGLMLAEKIRDAMPALRLHCHCGEGSFKSQFKRADKSGAQWALILGEEEAATDTISIKHLRSDQTNEQALSQQRINQNEIVTFFKKVVQGGKYGYL